VEKSIVIQLYQFIANYTADRHLYGHLLRLTTFFLMSEAVCLGRARSNFWDSLIACG